MNKLKTLCITTLLLFTINTAMAQDSYEFAEVHRYGFLIQIVTKAGVEEIKINKGENTAVIFMKKINELSNSGWDIYDATSSTGIIYFLRRKVD